MLAAKGKLEKLTFLCLYMKRKHTKIVVLLFTASYHLGNASRIKIHTKTKAFP